MNDQASSGNLSDLKSPVIAAIEARYQQRQDPYDGPRLSASLLGGDCERRLWYGFRWTHDPERFSGRMLRLFGTGDREEERIVADLRGVGIHVEDRDPGTGEQFRVLFANGHASGRTDGQCLGVPGAEKTLHLLECKTHNDRSFKDLKKKGVAASKPAHYAQVQIYMKHRSLTRCLYIAVNKNDDELYAERIKFDAGEALRLEAKAERIVAANKAPEKLHDDPDAKMAWMCRSCPALALCHEGAFARRNCRTCLHSSPVDDGGWRCERHDKGLSKQDQKAGCGDHLYLPSLVPGEQLDAAGNGHIDRVTYRLRDGAEFVDGAAP